MANGKYKKQDDGYRILCIADRVPSALDLNNKGMTLIELIIVVTIIGILVTSLAFSFQGWVSGYKVESQTKELYMDLINIRNRAMQRNRMHFVDLTSTQYTIYEDTNTAPDGDGISNPAADTQVSQKVLDARYPITWSVPAANRIQFDINGLSNNNTNICSNAPVDANGSDYNCIIISSTRINMGKLTTSIADGGACNAANCIGK
jgi:prepilin-type N-terminal cleavage/methylation domain-containing protein